jgi:Tfp pilus assembly protein PilO
MLKYKKHLIVMGLTWLGCTVLFIIVDVFLFAPQRKKRMQVDERLQTIKQTYRSALKAAQKENQDQQKQIIKDMQDRLDSFVINSRDSANIIFDVSQIANEKKLGSFTIKTEDGQQNTEIPECSQIRENHIAVSFTGDFDQFASFLNALERHSPVVFVDQFNITRAKPNEKGHKVNMQLAVLVKKEETG